MKALIRRTIRVFSVTKLLYVLILGLSLIALFLNEMSKPATLICVGIVAFCAYLFGRNRPRFNQKNKKTKLKKPTSENGVPEHLEFILNAISDPVIILDKSANIIYANSSAKTRLPNCQKNDPFSFCLRDPAVLEALENTIKSGLSTTVQYTERSPIERFYELIISAIKTPVESKNTIILMRDITRLQRMENTRADFVANASHELRTPLASIIGFIETLQGPAKADPKAHEKFLQIMGEQARRMSRLVDDLLSLSRIELTEHVSPKDQVDLVSVIKLIIDTLKGLAHERGVEIKLNVLTHPSVMVLGDRDELLRLFENLIENAIKYGQSGKQVDVSIFQQTNASYIDVSVKDYGEGIEPQHIPRLTERFYRADIDSSRQQGGTGLGLAIVKHIITRHHGTLKIESIKGQGAKFTISIPLLK